MFKRVLCFVVGGWSSQYHASVVPMKNITLVLVTPFLGIPKILYSLECFLLTIVLKRLLANDVRMS